MTIDNLKCFILVAENLSFARAAEALYISQPAVTKQINALEQELGVELFIRSTRHVELTPAGMSFYKDAKDIVLKSQMAINRLQRHNTNSDSIRIGLSNPVALFYLSPILKKLHTAYPDIRPSIELPGYKVVLSLFLENKLDLLFYFKENMPQKTDINFLELEQDFLSCLMPADHALAPKASISLEELTDIPIIACNPLNAPLSTASFQQHLLKKHPTDNILYCDSIEVAHCMVSSGMGISILPNILTLKSPEFVSVPLTGEKPLSFGVFYHKRSKNAALNQFFKLF
jgi:DNA-binding transcriptional LysR family regulator